MKNNRMEQNKQQVDNDGFQEVKRKNREKTSERANTNSKTNYKTTDRMNYRTNDRVNYRTNSGSNTDTNTRSNERPYDQFNNRRKDVLNKVASGDIKPEEADRLLNDKKPPRFVVTRKGSIALYNLGKEPIILYADQWEKLSSMMERNILKNYMERNTNIIKRRVYLPNLMNGQEKEVNREENREVNQEENEEE